MDSKTDILSRLYKAAKKHDADILKHFNDENLSDRNYFIYAINDDIMSNVISIILNLSLDNIESAGVDNSCRAIIEAMALLAVFNANKISDLQLKIFRCSYALVEIDNFKTILNITKLPIPKQIEEDRDRALNLFAEQFKMSREELDSLIKNRDPKKRLFLYDPLSFLMRTPKTKISYERLIKQYHPEGETLAKIYTFFSIFDHPRYEENIELELSIQEIKKTYVYMVINLVIKYFQINKLFIKDDEDITDDLQDLFDGEYKENNKKSLQAIEMIFSSLINELAMYGDEVDLQALFYINKLRCIAKYMFVCMHRGHREQVVAVFRPFAELSSVINKINTFNVDEYRILRKAFVFSSRLQLINFCDEVTNANTEIDTEGLKDLYEKYYKNKYKLDSFAEFEKNMTLNSMYFLDKNKKNYKSLVMDNADIIFNEKELKEEFKTIYKISIDVSHASGYSFNACQNVIDTFAYRSQIVFWKYIFQYIYLVAITKYEHGFTANIGQVMKAIATIINGLQDELNQLIK